MIRARTRPKMGVRQSTRISSPSHLAWVRTRACLGTGGPEECLGKMEAHHVRHAHNAGTGLKPGDDAAVPLCALHHKILHDAGHLSFQRDYVCNLDKAAAEHWKASPHRYKAENR